MKTHFVDPRMPSIDRTGHLALCAALKSCAPVAMYVDEGIVPTPAALAAFHFLAARCAPYAVFGRGFHGPEDNFDTLVMVQTGGIGLNQCSRGDFEFFCEVLEEHGCGRTSGYISFPSIDVLRRCESPAELRLGVHLMLELWTSEFETQRHLSIDGKDYRLDFAVTWDGACATTAYNIAVEVDGHDFHERTKEQARRDRSRDRAMMMAGWHVMRFTGSEVWRDPVGCAQQVVRMIRKLEGHP